MSRSQQRQGAEGERELTTHLRRAGYPVEWGGSMTYGQTFELNPTLFHKDGSTRLNSGVTYTVKKNGSAVTGLITGNSFRPDSAGTYTITAAYSDGTSSWTTTSNIVVNRRTVTVTDLGTVRCCQPAPCRYRSYGCCRMAR